MDSVPESHQKSSSERGKKVKTPPHTQNKNLETKEPTAPKTKQLQKTTQLQKTKQKQKITKQTKPRIKQDKKQKQKQTKTKAKAKIKNRNRKKVC